MGTNSFKGYRLHLQRVIFSGGTIIRTIKYPLTPFHESSIPLIERFEEDVREDDLRIRGSINLPDYVEKPSIYTLADFWLDSLRAGVIWKPTANELTHFVRKFFNESSPAEYLFEEALKLNPRLRFFDKEKFIENIMLAGPKRSSGGSSGFTKTLIDTVKTEYRNDKEVENLIDNIVTDFYTPEGMLKIDSTVQNEYWKKEFDIDKSLLQRKTSTNAELEKLTFFVLPQLIDLKESTSPSELIKIRMSLFGESDYLALLGMDNNFNAFSHYLNYVFHYLHEGRTDELYHAFEERAKSIDRYKGEIMNSLQFLSTKAKQIGYPSVQRSWHHYRSTFGGKIQSWIKNSVNRDEVLKKQGEKLVKSINNIQKILDITLKSKSSVNIDTGNITFLLEKVTHILHKGLNNLSHEEFDVFVDILASARREINMFYQKYIKTDKDDTPVNKISDFKDFYDNIYKPVTFFSQHKLRENDKVISHSVDIIQEGIDIMLSFLDKYKSTLDPSEARKATNNDENDEDLYRKALQKLWKKIVTNSINSPQFKTKYIDCLKTSINDEDDWKEIFLQPAKYSFFRSGYEKGVIREVELKNNDYGVKFKTLIEDLYDFAESLRHISLYQDKGLVLDKVELLKMLVSYVIRYNTEEFFDINKSSFKHLEKAGNYVKLFNLQRLSKLDAATIYQSFISSDLRGALSLFSKEQYMSRYVLQIVNSNDTFPLFYYSKGRQIHASEVKTNTALSQMPHSYLVAIEKDIKLKKKSDTSPFIRLNKTYKDLVHIDPLSSVHLLKISTSPYQLQFLDRYISPTKDWQKVKVSLSEWSFIVEKEYNIVWNEKEKKPVFKQIDKSKLYLALPFQISSKVGEKNAELATMDSDRRKNPFLGIDVGEYGIGWVLAKFDTNEVRILKSGFIKDKNIAAIRDKFSKFQQRSRRGIYYNSSTVLAEVRENAIGAIRNQIHDILTQEKASVIYEYSISNFETGSGRITKIYNSVKRSDVYGEIEADKSQHKHVWGDKTKNPGMHLSAYASSYTCVKCARSIFEFDQDDMSQAQVIKRVGNIVTIRTSKGHLLGYTNDKTIKEDTILEGKKGRELLLKFVKDFARPPITSRSETIRKYVPQLHVSLLRHISRARGNSALFICPFEDCLFSVDADIQAACIMAIRGYLKETSKMSEQSETIKHFDKTLAFLRSLKSRDSICTSFHVVTEDVAVTSLARSQKSVLPAV